MSDGTVSGSVLPVSVSVVMGSKSDLEVMESAAAVLDEFGVPNEVRIVSAHRTPHDMVAFGAEAEARGVGVIIAGAGGAAHLPGMLASLVSIPVIGVPVPLRHLDGMDSLLSIVQMPSGVPVATVAIGNATNAGLLAVRMLAIQDPELRRRMTTYRESLSRSSRGSGTDLRSGRSAAGDSPRDEHEDRT
jgi:5-(carboxyamino)imidazole ribonucleotide mutase